MMTTSGSNSAPTPNTIRRILFANAKGGCGKSTLATNLASIYAQMNIPVALVDHDPQASASQWLRRRPSTIKPIVGIDAFKRDLSGQTGNWFMRLPRDTHRVIIDTPAGLQGKELQDQVRQADVIIVPVLPSPIDIHAATRFIGSVLLSGEYRKSTSPKQLLVLANRTRKNTRVLHKLDLFLNTLRLPRIGSIRDTQHYVHCSESGTGVIDLIGTRYLEDRQHWIDILMWLENHFGSPLKGEQETNCQQNTQRNVNQISQFGEAVYTVGDTTMGAS